MFKKFNLENITKTEYLFFTGKGGVGKTSLSASLAINYADKGRKILLISTDPASNLQDIFKTDISNKPQPVEGLPNLYVLNLDPEKAAKEYKESVLSMYRGLLPESALINMDEQLSGSCTVEIAAFNEFSSLLTDEKIQSEFDCVIFDTAPTGHTLRMLELPAAWNGYIETTGGNASCLGQLSGLIDKKNIYEKAAATLKDSKQTMLYLVTRPQKLAIFEAARTSKELQDIGINNQVIVFNYILENSVKDDMFSQSFYNAQQEIMTALPKELNTLPKFSSYLMPFNIVGIENIRALISGKGQIIEIIDKKKIVDNTSPFKQIIDDLYCSGKKVIFTMGKGGVGKSTIACLIAKGLSEKGVKVHLTTTDPAAHLKQIISGSASLRITEINPKKEIENYRAQIILEASKTMTKENIDYIKEDLMSPCTEEIAVFKAFADIIDGAGDEILVIDTAPTGHTLLLLDTTQSYAKEAARASRKAETTITKLLPRLRDANVTEMIIVTLPEATPYYESMRLRDDLIRAGIQCNTFVINNVTANIETKDAILFQRGMAEIAWIEKICKEISNVYLSKHTI